MVAIASVVREQRAFHAMGKTRDVGFRLDSLRRLEVWIRSHDEQIMAALASDLNKPRFESYATEVGAVLDEVRFAQKHLRHWCRAKRVGSNLKNFPSSGRIYPEPYGVALIMSPWNYPFFLTMGPLVGALAAGNCVVVKPSAYSPATSSLLAGMCAELFDPAYVQVIEGGREQNQALLDERYDIILFTGSKAVGRTVLEAAARYLTPVILELGGKSPCIVDETADIRLAARRIAWGKFINAGQTCVAPDYVLVHESVRQHLLEELARSMEAQFGQRPSQDPGYSRIVNERHFDRLRGLLQDEHVFAGGDLNPDTLQIGPTLLDEVDGDSAVMAQEIFGPLLPVLGYSTLEEALRQIRERPKPLAAYLFTSSKAHKAYVLEHLSFGGGCINDTVVHLSVPRLPFGGVGESGMGSYHGKAGFDAFTHYRSVLVKSRHIDIPLRYPPYSETALKLLKRM